METNTIIPIYLYIYINNETYQVRNNEILEIFISLQSYHTPLGFLEYFKTIDTKVKIKKIYGSNLILF